MSKNRKLFIIKALAVGLLAGSIAYFFFTSQKPSNAISDFNYQRDHQFVKDVYEKNKYWLFEGAGSSEYLDHLLRDRRSIFESSSYEPEIIKVMYVHSEPVGFVTYSKTKFYQGRIRLLGVSEKYRGKGYGYLLLKHAMDDLISQGSTNIYLITRATNYPAHKIYKKAGFDQTEVHNGIVRFDYFKLDT